MISNDDIYVLDKIAIELFVRKINQVGPIKLYEGKSIAKDCYFKAIAFMIMREEVRADAFSTEIKSLEDLKNWYEGV